MLVLSGFYMPIYLFSRAVERELLAERELSAFARQYDRTLANILGRAVATFQLWTIFPPTPPQELRQHPLRPSTPCRVHRTQRFTSNLDQGVLEVYSGDIDYLGELFPPRGLDWGRGIQAARTGVAALGVNLTMNSNR